MNDTEVTTFNAISKFIEELNKLFGKRHKPLKLYHHLIEKTTFSHKKAIRKHIEGFRKFCIANRDAIVHTKSSLLKMKVLTYSKHAYIDMAVIFKLATTDVIQVIWKHLLYISARVDPAGNAKKVLTKNVSEGKTSGNEAKFLENIISKVETSVGSDTKDPMSALSSIMSSGVFTDLLGGMQNGLQSGQLDLGKLMGAVQGMVSNLEGKVDGKESADTMNMITNMTKMMGTMTQASGAGPSNGPSGTAANMPDMTQMMSVMMGSMGGMTSNARPATIEEVEEESDGDENNKKTK